MSLSDPIGDMLTRIRNGCKAEHDTVTMPSSNLKVAVADVLKSAGYINDYAVDGEPIKSLTIDLKYHNGEPVIEGIKRISRPSCRIYVSATDIPQVLGGLGMAILSTSKGVMTGRAAKKENLGGEVLCYVW